MNYATLLALIPALIKAGEKAERDLLMPRAVKYLGDESKRIGLNKTTEEIEVGADFIVDFIIQEQVFALSSIK